MKNIELMHSVWVTPEFKTNDLVRAVESAALRAPIYLYEISHPREKLQLSAMWRFIAKRQYDNPYIQDLYYFHELCHAASLSYEPSSFEGWTDKISENELYASLMSEVFIYFYMPEIRGKTFDNLWATQFFDNRDLAIPKDFLTLDGWQSQMQDVIKARRVLRGMESSTNSEEKWIIKFNRMRDLWLQKWMPHYQLIDETMIRFMSSHNEAELMDFLNSHSTHDVPFFDVVEK